MARDDIGLDIDISGFQRSLDDIGRRALPKAAAETLNNAAFLAQRALTAEVDAVFDRPTPFTRKAFVVVKARHTDPLDSMASIVRAKDRQAEYLRPQIEGGTRGPGDPGVGGARDVFTFGIRQTKAGGIARGLSKRLSADLDREQSARDMYWSAAHLARSTGGTRPQADSYARNNAAGSFFGIVNGIKGYWRRPRRKLSQILGKLTLLLRVQPEAYYKPKFPYNEVIQKAFSQNAAQADFARNLDKEIAYRLERGGFRPSASNSAPTSGFRRPSWFKG